MRGRSGTGFVLDEHGAQALARDIRQRLVKDDGYLRSRSNRLLSRDVRREQSGSGRKQQCSLLHSAFPSPSLRCPLRQPRLQGESTVKMPT